MGCGLAAFDWQATETRPVIFWLVPERNRPLLTAWRNIIFEEVRKVQFLLTTVKNRQKPALETADIDKQDKQKDRMMGLFLEFTYSTAMHYLKL